MRESRQDSSGPVGNFELCQGETGTYPVYFEIPAASTGVVHFRASVMNATGIANPDVTVRPLHPVVKFPPGSMGYAELVVSFGENASPELYFFDVAMGCESR